VTRMHSTRISQHVRAPRAAVYRALTDAAAIALWRVPAGMTSTVHEFNANEGGTFRVSLTYDEPTGTGKSAANTDTYHGHFAELVPDEKVVEVMQFESAEESLRTPMTMTTTLTDTGDGTTVTVQHDDIPDDIAPADNETGTREALARLAALVEGR
jgi:uncharacterized protein YndB with AHSA1/START domain